MHSRASASTVTKHFGGWCKALTAAGLVERYGGGPVTERMKRQPGKSISSDEVVSELRRVAKKLNRNYLTVEDFNMHGAFSSAVVMNHFKHWRQALKAADLFLKRPSSARYSDEECYENLLEVWTLLGRPPHYLEMNAPPSRVGSKAYVGRWGGWMKALEAFVDRVNEDTPYQPVTSESFDVAPVLALKAVGTDDGKIRLGIRYKVLVRDNFRCVLCGNSPATDPACRLHVDHVHPYSKDGRTELDNLRTLCSVCNIGKSNLTIETDR